MAAKRWGETIFGPPKPKAIQGETLHLFGLESSHVETLDNHNEHGSYSSPLRSSPLEAKISDQVIGYCPIPPGETSIAELGLSVSVAFWLQLM